MPELFIEFSGLMSLHFPDKELSDPYSFPSSYYVAFELGDELANGTKERVVQAVQRASSIFRSCFPDGILWLLVYEFPGPKLFDADDHYLWTLIEKEAAIDSKTFAEDGDAYKALAVKLTTAQLHVDEMFEGIANIEMGFSPGIDQIVYVISFEKQMVFQMYDDRGLIIRSNETGPLREVYQKYSEWIRKHDQHTITQFFQHEGTDT